MKMKEMMHKCGFAKTVGIALSLALMLNLAPLALQEGKAYAAGDPTIRYGYALEDDGTGYLCFNYDSNSTQSTTALVSGGNFNTGLTASDLDASKLPPGISLTAATATATTLSMTFSYAKENLLFQGAPWSAPPKIGVLDIKVKPGGFSPAAARDVDVPVIAEVVKENEIPLGARLYREFEAQKGGLENTAASQLDFSPDVVPSPYYTENDYYNRGGKLDTMYLLPNYKTIQQATGYSCGVTSQLTMLDFYGKRAAQTVATGGDAGKTIDLNEYDLSKLRDGDFYNNVATPWKKGGSDYGGATYQGEILKVFEGLNTYFNQDWNVVSGKDLLTNASAMGEPDMKRFVYDSAPDINVVAGTLQGDQFDMTLFDALKWYVRHGVPVLIGWNTWGGHYEVMVGYDDMGTTEDGDDVLIVADPYDSTDHLKDGYITRSWKKFVDDWSVGAWGGTAYDENGTQADKKLENFVFAAAWPTTAIPDLKTQSAYTTPVVGAALPQVEANQLAETYPMPMSTKASYRKKLKQQKQDLGSALKPLPTGTDHAKSPYYKFFDPYDFPIEEGVVLEDFGTIQQAGENLDGPASLLMTLNHYIPQNNLTELDLAEKKGSGKELTKTTLADMKKMIQSVPGQWRYYSTDDLNKEVYGTKLSETNVFDTFLEQGIPIMILTHEGGDRWQTVIGIDHRRTADTQDDLLILADSKDTGDHNQNGYTTYPLEYVMYDWQNSIDKDYPRQVFVALYPFEILIFDSNGGTPVNNPKHFKVGDILDAIPLSSRSGYTFAGWYTAKVGGAKVLQGTKILSGMTLYARWIPKKYTLTFDVNGGKKLQASKVTFTFATKYGALPKTSRSYKKFAGWYTDETGGKKITASTTITRAEDHTLYAHWNPLKGKATRKVSILSKANQHGKKVGILKKGKRIIVKGAKGKYYKVKYKGKIRFIKKKYLKLLY